MNRSENRSPVKINMNMIMQNVLKSTYSPELKEKNNLDNDLGFYATPLIRKMFVNQAERYDRKIFNYRDELTFDMITADMITLKTITPKQYGVLPRVQRDKNFIPVKAFFKNIVFFIIMMVVLYFTIFIPKGSKKVEMNFFLIFLAFALIFVICFIKSILTLRSHLVSADAQVGVGNAIWFDIETISSGDDQTYKYYVDVAFYDEKRFVRRIECDEKQFKKMYLDSEVMIYNLKAYAI